MTEATWSRHPRALVLCHLRKQNKRDNEKTEISPKKVKSNLDSKYTNRWCGLDRTHAQDHITLERAGMDSCSILLGLISVAQPFYYHALIIVIIIIIIIINIKLVTFPIYLSFCIQIPSLLHEFLWGTRQGKRKLSRISASEDKALSQKRALFATLRELTDVRDLKWKLEVQESTSTKLPRILASPQAQ